MCYNYLHVGVCVYINVHAMCVCLRECVLGAMCMDECTRVRMYLCL